MPSTHHGILIHVVFSTKNRVPLIEDHWRDELCAYIGGTARDHKATILCSGGIEDHVHLLAKTHPSFAISDTVQLIKSNASRWINQLRKTRSLFEWQRGYGAFSVANRKLRGSGITSIRSVITTVAKRFTTSISQFSVDMQLSLTNATYSTKRSFLDDNKP